jgi:hypothetical protein
MKIRKFLFTAILFSTPLMALAQTQVNTGNATLTFSNHWEHVTGEPTNAYWEFLDTAHLAIASIQSLYNGAPDQIQNIFMNGLTMQKAGGVTTTDSSTKQLGSQTFKVKVWNSLGSGSAPEDRARGYYISKNGSYFFAFLSYKTPVGDPAVTEFEAQLATLTFVSVGIPRPVGWNPRTKAARIRLDLLGRWLPLSQAHTARATYYPARP